MSHSGGSGKYRAKKDEGLVPMAGAQGGGQRGYRGLSKGEGGSCEVREVTVALTRRWKEQWSGFKYILGNVRQIKISFLNFRLEGGLQKK